MTSTYRARARAVAQRKYPVAMAVAGALTLALLAYVVIAMAFIAAGVVDPGAPLGCTLVLATILFALELRRQRTALVLVEGGRVRVTATIPPLDLAVDDIAEVAVTEDRLFGWAWQDMTFRMRADGREPRGVLPSRRSRGEARGRSGDRALIDPAAPERRQSPLSVNVGGAWKRPRPTD